MGTGASTSDKSSGVKSISTPSTPQAESVNFQSESRLSHSLLMENTPKDILSEARKDRDGPDNSFLGQETPLVCNIRFYIHCLNLNNWSKYNYWHSLGLRKTSIETVNVLQYC